MTKCNNRLFPRFVIKMNLLKFIANVLFLKKMVESRIYYRRSAPACM